MTGSDDPISFRDPSRSARSIYLLGLRKLWGSRRRPGKPRSSREPSIDLLPKRHPNAVPPIHFREQSQSLFVNYMVRY